MAEATADEWEVEVPVDVAVIQHDIVWEDYVATLGQVSPRVDDAVAAGATCIVLPEMFATGWSMESQRTAQPEEGPIVTWMQERAAKHGVLIAGSVATVDGNALPTNRLLVVDPGGVVERYDKRHLVSTFAEHKVGENQRFRAGNAAAVVHIGGVRFGLTICYDLRFADAYWDIAEQVDAYIVVANWPQIRRHHWTSLLRARAIENQAYVVGANRIGEGGGLTFAGDSCIIDPMGEIIASTAGIETTISARLDESTVADVRAAFPFLTDRITG